MPAPGLVRPRRADERAYLAALRSLLDPSLIGLKYRLSLASSYHGMLEALDAVVPADMPELVPLVERQLGRIADYHRWRTARALGRALGVDIRPLLTDAAIQPFLHQRVAENVALIQTIEPRYHADLLRDIIRLQAETPFDRAALQKMLARNYRSTGYNLRRLTRDQNNKMIGQLTGIRQRELGVEQYIWRTSADERVRPSHESKNGQRFWWDAPPPDTGHPGYDIQCRCVAQAVIPESTATAAS